MVKFKLKPEKNSHSIRSQRMQTGPLAALYTNPNYRKRGLALSVVKSIFKQAAELDYAATACVRIENSASRAIFDKIGCKVIDQVNWISSPIYWNEENDANIAN